MGALLRLGWQRVRGHLNEVIRAAGFTDLQDAHFAVFSWPPPDGVRLSQLARQIGMSRQATNYPVGQLVALGYLERRAAAGSERRLIHLTRRGHEVVDTIFVSSRSLQRRRADEVGPARFAAFMEVLRDIHAAKIDVPPDRGGPVRSRP